MVGYVSLIFSRCRKDRRLRLFPLPCDTTMKGREDLRPRPLFIRNLLPMPCKVASSNRVNAAVQERLRVLQIFLCHRYLRHGGTLSNLPDGIADAAVLQKILDPDPVMRIGCIVKPCHRQHLPSRRDNITPSYHNHGIFLEPPDVMPADHNLTGSHTLAWSCDFAPHREQKYSASLVSLSSRP